MSDFRALAEKTVVELFDMVKGKVAEIEQLKSQLNNMEACYIGVKKECEELQKELSTTKQVLHNVIDMERSKRNKLQKRIDEALTWLTRTDIRAINMAREILQGGDLKSLRGEHV